MLSKITINVIAFFAGVVLALLLNMNSCGDDSTTSVKIPNNGSIQIDTKPEDTVEYDSMKNVYKIRSLIAENEKLRNKVSTNDELLKHALSQLNKKTDRVLVLEQQVKATFDVDLRPDTIIQIDSITGVPDTVIKFIGWKYSDEFASISIFEKPMFPGIFQMDLFGKARTTINYRWDRKWLFGKKNHYVDVSIDSKYFSLVDAENIQIFPKSRRIHLGGYVGYGATFSKNSISVGPQVGLGVLYTIF